MRKRLIVLAVLSSCTGADTHTGLREWKLAPAPTVTIGGEGSAQTEFTRVSGAWRLSNGAIAVVDGGSSEVRVFDPRGGFTNEFGRTGDGPGEFRQISWTGHTGDTAEVYDAGLRRITTILLVGAPRLIATLPVNANDDRSVDVVGRLADGRWLVRSMSRPDVIARGVQRLPGFAGLIASGATGSVQWLAEGPDMAILVYSVAANKKQMSVTMAPFPSWLVTTAAGSSVWFGNTAADSILRVDAGTGAKQTVKLPDPPAPLSQALVDSARASELAGTRDKGERALIEAKYSAPNLPPHLPVFQTIIPGRGGELWMQTSDGGRYLVISASGSPVARVAVASGFRITEAGRDYVVGVHRDDDGVETVQLYSLIR